ISADLNFKYSGWSAHGEYFWRTTDFDSVDDESEPYGFYAQVGYFFVPNKFEVAVRYAQLDCDSDETADLTGACVGAAGANEDTEAWEGVLNYYIWGHELKAQLGYARITEAPRGGGSDVDTNRWIFQLAGYM